MELKQGWPRTPYVAISNWSLWCQVEIAAPGLLPFELRGIKYSNGEGKGGCGVSGHQM